MCLNLEITYCVKLEPGSSAGMATDYGLDGPGSNPGEDKIFPPVQTGPGAHPASCKMGIGSFSGAKCCPGSNPSGGRVLPPVQTGPGAHPASCKVGTGFFLGGKVRPRRAAEHSPLLVPRSWKSRAITLPNLWATPGL